jgi:hypothetical protein
MKDLKHIKSFGLFKENLNISDVSVQSKHSVGDNVKTKKNIDNLLDARCIQRGIVKYLDKDCKIVDVYYDEKDKCHRYLIDIDNGDFWWVDESFD